MEILVYFLLGSIFVFVTIFTIDLTLIGKLSDSNKFKKWWKRNLIDEAPQDIDI